MFSLVGHLTEFVCTVDVRIFRHSDKLYDGSVADLMGGLAPAEPNCWQIVSQKGDEETAKRGNGEREK